MMVQSGSTVRLSPLVVRVTANNPGLMTGAGTNTYLIGRSEIAVLDPGPCDEKHINAILTAARKLFPQPSIRWIVVTHTHPDHSPAAIALAEKTGAEMVGCLLQDDGHQDRSFRVDHDIRHGDLIAGADFTLEAIATPGHVANHFCYFLREEGLVFTGDHIMGGSSVVIVPPSGDMTDYISSLRLLKNYPIQQLLPGHGDVINNPEDTIDVLIAHRLRREAKVLRVLRETGEITLEALTPLVYNDVNVQLHRVAQASLWAHLLKLEKECVTYQHFEQHWLFGEQRWGLYDSIRSSLP